MKLMRCHYPLAIVGRNLVSGTYMEGTGHGQKCRVIRRDGHETMPNFIGDCSHEMTWRSVQHYYASMLALLRPWRDIGDLKMQTETFKEAFDAFVAVTMTGLPIFLPIFNTNTNVATVRPRSVRGKGKQLILWEVRS